MGAGFCWFLCLLNFLPLKGLICNATLYPSAQKRYGTMNGGDRFVSDDLFAENPG